MNIGAVINRTAVSKGTGSNESQTAPPGMTERMRKANKEVDCASGSGGVAIRGAHGLAHALATRVRGLSAPV
jgi:hypothetical protein